MVDSGMGPRLRARPAQNHGLDETRQLHASAVLLGLKILYTQEMRLGWLLKGGAAPQERLWATLMTSMHIRCLEALRTHFRESSQANSVSHHV